MKQKPFRKISTKLTIYCCACMVLILFISDISIYSYFTRIMLEQEYNNEKDKIGLITNQMNYIVDDLERFALSIAIDGSIQKFLQGEEEERYELEKKLGRWEVQRDYIFNIALKTQDGRFLLSDSSMSSGIHSDSYADILGDTLVSQPEENRLFSMLQGIRNVKVLASQTRVLTVIMNVNHMQKYKVNLGQMIINLDYDRLLEVIIKNLDAVEFRQFYWLAEDGEILYPRSEGQEGQERRDVGKICAYAKEQGKKQFRMNHNYIVINMEDTLGWQFLSVTPLQDIWERTSYIIVFFVLSAVVAGLLGAMSIKYLTGRLMSPVTELKENMEKVKEEDFYYQPLVIRTRDEFEILADGYNEMMRRIQDYIGKSLNYEKEKRNLQISLLMAQINPHFIYNTLNTIIYLSYKQETDKIAAVTRSFISLLQDSVKIHDGDLFCTVEQEVEVLRSYLKIQENRYAGKFEIHMEVEEGVLKERVLRAILQPIAENSLLHGIFPKREPGNLWIRIEERKGEIMYRIEDDGMGMSEEKIEEIRQQRVSEKSDGVYSIGLNNIIRRLEMVYGEHYRMEIDSQAGAYTRFHLWIPMEEDRLL